MANAGFGSGGTGSTIRDDRDFAAHMDYIHFNPVKHGLAAHRRIGRIRHFIGPPPAGYILILPVGRVAATNRNRPANGSEPKRRKRTEEHDR